MEGECIRDALLLAGPVLATLEPGIHRQVVRHPLRYTAYENGVGASWLRVHNHHGNCKVLWMAHAGCTHVGQQILGLASPWLAARAHLALHHCCVCM